MSEKFSKAWERNDWPRHQRMYGWIGANIVPVEARYYFAVFYWTMYSRLKAFSDKATLRKGKPR